MEKNERLQNSKIGLWVSLPAKNCSGTEERRTHAV